MRLVVGILVFLVALAAGADFVARGIAEQRVAARLERVLELGTEPDVEMRGFPFLLNLARGMIPTLEVSLGEVRRRGVTVEEVTLELENVRFDLSSLSREGGSVRVGGGSGSAKMTDERFGELLSQHGAPVEVRFERGDVFVAAEGTDREVKGDIALEGRSIVVSAPEFDETYTVPLPRIGANVSYRSLDIGDGEVVLRLALGAGRLRL